MNSLRIQALATGLVLVSLLAACVSRSPVSSAGGSVDDNFDEFIQKFSSDADFQLSRTKFPLKVRSYDLDTFSDVVTYVDRSRFEILDFRQKASTGRYDQWKQHVTVDRDETAALIEIRGIENGINLKHVFKNMDNKWMLVEIYDKST